MSEIDIPGYPLYLDCKSKKIADLIVLERKVALPFGNLDFFYFYNFSNDEIYRVKQLFKVNQIDITDHQKYVV